MQTEGGPLFLVSWFTGCSEPDVMARLRSGGIDGIELRHVDDESGRIRAAGLAVSFHLPFPNDGTPPEINLANDRILRPYRDGRMAGLAASCLPFLGFHFGYSALEVEKRHGPEMAVSPTLSRDETEARIGTTVAELATLTGRTILLENMDYGPTGALEYVWEPQFLRACAEAWGCGTILDVAHAMVSAAPLELTTESYLEALIRETAHLVRSIHVNAPCNGLDMHLPATPEVLHWLHRGLSAGARPATIILERIPPTGLPPVHFAEMLVSELPLLREACA